MRKTRPVDTIGSRRWIVAACAGLLVGAWPYVTRAADGCTALLCLASGNWNVISQCVPTVRQVLRDLARGRPFPSCESAGSSNAAVNDWAWAPSFCPPQYMAVLYSEGAAVYSCAYTGAISVQVDGRPFLRTWWRPDGDSVTEYTPAAKTTLGTWDTRFEDDYAAWLANQPPPPPDSPI